MATPIAGTSGNAWKGTALRRRAPLSLRRNEIGHWRARPQSRDRAVTDAIGVRDVGHAIAGLPALQSFGNLERREFRLAAEAHAARHGSGSPLAGPRED